MKHRVMLILITLLLLGCQPGPGLVPAKAPAVSESASLQTDSTLSDWERSLATFQQVDDYPLYVMTYYEDYDLDSYFAEREASTSADAHWACTTFAALTPTGESLLGRNFDWKNQPSLLLFTDPPDGYAAATMVDLSYMGFDQNQPTAEQLENLIDAPYWTFDGMNEAGLAIGMMAVPHAEGGTAAAKPTLGSLTTMRYLLDYAADVEEAIDLLDGINVDFEDGPPLHYLIADAAGNSAVLEFVDDELLVLRPSDRFQVSTNYVISAVPEEQRTASCPRYGLVTEALAQSEGQITMDDSMTLLSQVSSNSSTNPTMWSVVYNVTSGDINIVVNLQYDNVHTFKLDMLH